MAEGGLTVVKKFIIAGNRGNNTCAEKRCRWVITAPAATLRRSL